jgi:hypothetical protein
MISRWLAPLAVALALNASLHAGPPADAPVGCLVVPPHDATAGQFALVPYHPCAGDIVLFDSGDWWYRLGFTAIGTGPPFHVAIAFERLDGTPALLDITGKTVAGAKVLNLDVAPRLQDFTGGILVRRLIQPLGPEQSAALCRFAQAQEGKDFAFGRLLLQGTPFTARAGLRRWLFGRTYLERDRWMCSEIVIAAATVANVLEPGHPPANSVYPRDLAYDEHGCDLSACYQPPVRWIADPNLCIFVGRAN